MEGLNPANGGHVGRRRQFHHKGRISEGPATHAARLPRLPGGAQAQ
jgi:hypothetical protein